MIGDASLARAFLGTAEGRRYRLAFPRSWEVRSGGTWRPARRQFESAVAHFCDRVAAETPDSAESWRIRSRAAIVALRCERLALAADDPLARIGRPDFERAMAERAARSSPDA